MVDGGNLAAPRTPNRMVQSLRYVRRWKIFPHRVEVEVWGFEVREEALVFRS